MGAPFVAYEPNLGAAIFSGAGASLVQSLLNKTNPVDIAAGVEFVLNDGELRDNHPVLNLLQQFIEPVDPINYARLFFRSLPAQREVPTHVLQTYGLDDTYSPNATMNIFGLNAGVQLAQPSLESIQGMGSVELPAMGNRQVGGEPVTAVMIQADPGDDDGHFVLYRDADIRDQAAHFLGSMVRNGIPTVPIQ